MELEPHTSLLNIQLVHVAFEISSKRRQEISGENSLKAEMWYVKDGTQENSYVTDCHRSNSCRLGQQKRRRWWARSDSVWMSTKLLVSNPPRLSHSQRPAGQQPSNVSAVYTFMQLDDGNRINWGSERNNLEQIVFSARTATAAAWTSTSSSSSPSPAKQQCESTRLTDQLIERANELRRQRQQ